MTNQLSDRISSFASDLTTMTTLSFVPELLGWKDGRATIADKGSVPSCAISASMLRAMNVTVERSHVGQTAGKALEDAIQEHLIRSLPPTQSGRSVVVSRKTVISDFEQYRHLATVKKLIDADETETLRSAIGGDYAIKPDVTVGLEDDQGSRFLHAAIPCKWTLRSDRAQNVRHEAVVLIRNRRGRLPHIAPVTAEPLPTRLASLARGTGEVDALYHVALAELEIGVRESGATAQIRVFEELVAHGRLKDLSELAPALAF
ncbi:MAG: restriction endonuclease [Actinobacteria bacterium]|nr:restriction endonuclease [Actinomycetota bacterium]